MTFVNTRLSDKVAQGFQGGPMWNTLIVPMAGGAESRNSEWSMPHYQFIADYTTLRPTERDEIVSAFMAMRGSRDSLRFKDWKDFKAENQSLGTGNNTITPRQLRKYYTFGSATYGRDIILPIASTLVVKANGTPITVSVDDATGLVTPSAPWPNGQVLTASFQFDVRVRFGKDYYAFTMPAKDIAQVSVDLVQAITP